MTPTISHMTAPQDTMIRSLSARVSPEAIEQVAQWCDDMGHAVRNPKQSWLGDLIGAAVFRAMAGILRDPKAVNKTPRRRKR